MRKIPLSMLTPDMTLGRPVCSSSHVLINAGVRNLNRYRGRLAALGINYLYIEDDASEGIEIEDLVTEQTRSTCRNSLKKSFKRMNKHFSVNIKEVVNISESLIFDILDHRTILYNLNEIGSMGDNTLDHSLNTTIYAICLGRQLRYTPTQLKDLATGTLLHDIGKTLLNHNILFKPSKLTEEEFAHVKEHAQLGYDFLCKDKNISEMTRQVCLYHHERMDGSGYPYGLTGDQLPDFVKIASIVDVYEALTVNRCYHNAITPLQAMNILIEDSSSKLDFSFVTTFTQNIAIYPTGTNVLLSDGRYAIIKQQNESFPLRPLVRTIEMQGGKCVPKEEIDLLKTLNITIMDSDIAIPTS